MQSIEAGGDPLRLKPKAISKAAELDAMEQVAGKGVWGNVKDFWNGTRSPEEAPDPAAAAGAATGALVPPQADAAKPLSAEAQLRLDEKVTPDLSPEDEAALVDVYGAAAVEAAKLRKQMQ